MKFDEFTSKFDEFTSKFDEFTSKFDEFTPKFNEFTPKFDEFTSKFDEFTLKFDEFTGGGGHATDPLGELTIFPARSSREFFKPMKNFENTFFGRHR